MDSSYQAYNIPMLEYERIHTRTDKCIFTVK